MHLNSIDIYLLLLLWHLPQEVCQYLGLDAYPRLRDNIIFPQIYGTCRHSSGSLWLC